MGKHGPCYHCGVTSTPLWRNGPPDKPVLCNACGSRWRTKGTLLNYTPIHKREMLELAIPKKPKEKGTVLKLKLNNYQKGQHSHKIVEAESGIRDHGYNFLKVVEEDTSNRSSSGSAMSFTESCANFSGADVSEVTGSFHINAWESVVPSRKRTGVVRPKRSAVEKLTRDLHSIMHEQSSYLTVSSEEDLLYESTIQTGLIEIGNGSVLIRHPSSAIVEEESEASSFPLQNKSTCAGLSLVTDCQSKASAVFNLCDTKNKNSSVHEQLKREKTSQDQLHILRNKDSQLGSIDLEDIVCLEGYMTYFTNEERQKLTTYLPSIDTVNPPESLESMFSSIQFLESMSSFQYLLQQGIFDICISTSLIKPDDCKNLRKLILSTSRKGAWVESFKILKDEKHNTRESKKETGDGTNLPGYSCTSSLKRQPEIHDKFSEPKLGRPKGLKKPCKAVRPSLGFMTPIKQIPVNSEENPKIEFSNYMESNCSRHGLESPCATPLKKKCVFDSLQLADGSMDAVLLDVRSCTSFPEAELLSDVWLQNVPAKRFCGDNGVSGKEGSLPCQSAVSFAKKPPTQW